MRKLYERLVTWISLAIIARITWNSLRALFNGGVYYSLREADHDYLRGALKKGYFIVLTRRKSHFTTYLIALASFIKCGKFAHYTHALMNTDDGKPQTDDDYRLLEATGVGVHYSTFMQVFDCDSVVLLHPKGFTLREWVEAAERAVAQLGKPYDCLFDAFQYEKLSCVELVRCALMGLPDYPERFKAFEAMVTQVGRLTPQMLYDCPDFEKVWEVRR